MELEDLDILGNLLPNHRPNNTIKINIIMIIKYIYIYDYKKVV